MASLTHVCVWSDNGWKHISAEEAAKRHPGGTVSAHSGLFMCELCGQYVLLTDGYVKVRHFRHSSAEKSKDCPERTFGAGVSYYFKAGEHELPLRIKLSPSGFSFEVGFIRVPNSLLSKNFKIEITSSSRDAGTFVFLRERLNSEGITYLPVGNIPSERYNLTVYGAQEALYQYWPRSIQGVNLRGSIFDAATGKRLIYDSDVEVGKKYYLLKRGPYGVYSHVNHVSVREVRSVQLSWDTWKLYEVVANDYDEETARFFLDYHCRLTERPVNIQPLWPVYVETPYVIKHSQKSVVFLIQGDAPNMQVFPTATVRKCKSGESIVAEIQCNNRQQLISAGRAKVLQYTYFWQEPLKETTPQPNALVTDLNGNKQEPGIVHVLPVQHILRIQIPYDGAILKKKNGVLIDKRKANAGSTLEIDDISWNMEIQVAVGCDIVWSTAFVKEEKYLTTNEYIILKRLTSYKGPKMPISHEIGNLAGKIVDYPKIRLWLYECIRDGYMNERAFRELQSWIVNEKKDGGGAR